MINHTKPDTSTKTPFIQYFSTSQSKNKKRKNVSSWSESHLPRGFYYISGPNDCYVFRILQDNKRILTRFDVRAARDNVHMALSFSKQNPERPTLNEIYSDMEPITIVKTSTYRQALVMCTAIPEWEDGEILFQGPPLSALDREKAECVRILEECNYDAHTLINTLKYKSIVDRHAVYINSVIDLHNRGG